MFKASVFLLKTGDSIVFEKLVLLQISEKKNKTKKKTVILELVLSQMFGEQPIIFRNNVISSHVTRERERERERERQTDRQTDRERDRENNKNMLFSQLVIALAS